MRSTRRTQGQKLPPTIRSMWVQENRHDPSAGSVTWRLLPARSFNSFAEIMQGRQREADEFYRAITPKRVSERCSPRHATSTWPGCCGASSNFGFDVDNGSQNMAWIRCSRAANKCATGMVPHGKRPHHFHAGQVGVSLVCRVGPGVHTIALSTVDVDFAKAQLDLMLQEFFLHPTGQIPAYEWNFSDVNPPCTPGQPSSCTGRNRRSRAKPTWDSSGGLLPN